MTSCLLFRELQFTKYFISRHCVKNTFKNENGVGVKIFSEQINSTLKIVLYLRSGKYETDIHLNIKYRGDMSKVNYFLILISSFRGMLYYVNFTHFKNNTFVDLARCWKRTQLQFFCDQFDVLIGNLLHI